MMDAAFSSSRAAPSSYWLEGFARQDHGDAAIEDERVERWYRNLLGRYLPPVTAAALDIGCGRGRVIRAVAGLAPGCRHAGIDGSEATLAIARRRLAEQHIEADLYQVDLVQPGYAPMLLHRHGRFDLITSMFVLHHYPPAVAGVILSELRRLMAPGGVMILAEAHDPQDREASLTEEICAELAALAGQAPDLLWTEAELRDACRLGGFTAAETRFVNAPGAPFTAVEAEANRQVLERLRRALQAAEGQLGGTAPHPKLAALKRVVGKMRENGIARPSCLAPRLAILQLASMSVEEESCR
jgi:SAM-dependent methyltransferase